jgi:adenylate cyclase
MTVQPKTSITAHATGLSTTPDYSVATEPVDRHIVGELFGKVIVDSRNAIQLNETRYAPTYYFPKEDVNMDALTSTSHHTHCPFKGDASYWSVSAGGRMLENVAWSYEDPYPVVPELQGRVAFYADKMDAWFEDDVRVTPERENTDKDVHTNPLAQWIISEAWDAPTSRELTARFIRQLNKFGMQISRVNIVIQTLHPLIVATSYRWKPGEEVERIDAPYAMREEIGYYASPFVTIFNGMGGLRRWIGTDDENDDYPILADLRAQGVTDYAAMPMRFSDGQINAVTIATENPEGFSTEHLGWMHEILPALSRYYEVHAKRRTSSTLMRTFLGRHTGQRVLDGLIQRGDGEDIHAVIWFSDLRNSTPIAEKMGRENFLAYLNRFFDCMAGAVIDNEGEVLRFIGDAVMAIFPIADQGEEERRTGGCAARDATARAIEAAREATRRIEAANEQCLIEGLPCIGYGIGMHVGHVTYGNIGTEDRLEFTVIGAAANEAARIENVTKELGRNVILSQDFSEMYGGDDLESLGEHSLRGVSAPQTVYTLKSDV